MRDDPALEALTAMQRETIALADGVRHVSHELHPTLLQHAGLVEALRGLCAQYQKLHGFAVDYRAEPDLDALPHDAALALYRVAQEALRNVSKHAGASHVELSLTRVEDGVQLSIVDNGKGFNLPDRRGRPMASACAASTNGCAFSGDASTSRPQRDAAHDYRCGFRWSCWPRRQTTAALRRAAAIVGTST